MGANRTFKIGDKPMKGKDVEAWEKELVELFDSIGIDAPIVANGVYADLDRSYTKSFAHAVGLNASQELAHGLTPELRTKLRHWKDRQTDREAERMEERVDYRRRLRERYDEFADAEVSTMVGRILQDSWGYHPGVHDGIDLITLPDVRFFSPVAARVIDVRPDGWWRLGAPLDPKLRGRGDGIIQLRIEETVGPFVKGRHIGFGHAEKALVVKNQLVKAGTPLGHIGFANAWHAHFMYNNGLTTRGIGNIDPRDIVDYSVKNG